VGVNFTYKLHARQSALRFCAVTRCQTVV